MPLYILFMFADGYGCHRGKIYRGATCRPELNLYLANPDRKGPPAHHHIGVFRMNCYVASKLLDDVYMALHVVYARPLPTPIHMILVLGPLAAEIVEGHKSTISTLGAFAAKFAMFAAIIVTVPQQTGGGAGWTRGHHSY